MRELLGSYQLFDGSYYIMLHRPQLGTAHNLAQYWHQITASDTKISKQKHLLAGRCQCELMFQQMVLYKKHSIYSGDDTYSQWDSLQNRNLMETTQNREPQMSKCYM